MINFYVKLLHLLSVNIMIGFFLFFAEASATSPRIIGGSMAHSPPFVVIELVGSISFHSLMHDEGSNSYTIGGRIGDVLILEEGESLKALLHLGNQYLVTEKNKIYYTRRLFYNETEGKFESSEFQFEIFGKTLYDKVKYSNYILVGAAGRNLIFKIDDHLELFRVTQPNGLHLNFNRDGGQKIYNPPLIGTEISDFAIIHHDFPSDIEVNKYPVPAFIRQNGDYRLSIFVKPVGTEPHFTTKNVVGSVSFGSECDETLGSKL